MVFRWLRDASSALIREVKSSLIQSNKVTTIYTLDPLQDPRWPELLKSHPAASVFHTPSWLEALRRTYGYESTVFTTSSSGEELKNGMVFCRIQSWMTGCRMVSLPFSDHCQPLVDDPEDLRILLSYLTARLDREKWKYVELRPLVSPDLHPDSLTSFAKSSEFYYHKLDLRPDLETLFGNFHRASTRKTIRHAQRENLAYEQGRSEAFIAKFYHLLLLTRRRHQVPPQPIAWFRNLADCFGDRMTIRIISKDGCPVATALMLSYKNCLMDKYGCSDARYHSLGGMPLLLWKAIQEAKELGLEEFDVGRSDTDNPGLVAFKDHLGAACSKLCYFRASRHASDRSGTSAPADWSLRLAKGAFARMPDSLLKIAGNLLYRHMG